MDQETKPRFPWRRTWKPGQVHKPLDHDFLARVPNDRHGFCRTYLYREAPRREWYWVANSWCYIASGFADTPREAALRAEAASMARRKAEGNGTAEPSIQPVSRLS